VDVGLKIGMLFMCIMGKLTRNLNYLGEEKNAFDKVLKALNHAKTHRKGFERVI
jgi:hypothetical protein